MVDHPPERITGPRLVLRLPVLNDAGALFQRVARDPEVTKYLMWAPHPDVAATRRVITEKLNVGGDERTWVIELRQSGEVIGLASCRRPVPHSVEVGYCLGRRWWGKGLMAEALDMLLAALDADPLVYRVWATCSVDNARSARLLERAGFALEGWLAAGNVLWVAGRRGIERADAHESLLESRAVPCRCLSTTPRHIWSAIASMISKRRFGPGASSTVRLLRLDCPCSPSSSAMCSPGRCRPGGRPAGGLPTRSTARPW